MTSQSPSRRLLRILALLVGFSMLVAACGDDDDTNADGDGSDTTGQTDDGSGDDDEVVDDGTGSGDTDGDVGDPVPGGKIVYGLEADTSSPWTPQAVVCAISCHMVMRSVFDTLTMYAEGGEIKPNLLESFSSNDDFTQWTLTPRSGITFHDGTPFDAAAIKANLDGHLVSFLTARALQINDDAGAPTSGVSTIELSEDGASVVVTMTGPWSNFPGFLSGQIGYMASPTWLAAVADGSAKQDAPVGTGPFVFKSYEPGGSFIATKNAAYFRDGLPYIDEIEYRVIADVQARRTALLNGDINMTHTSAGDTIKLLREEDGIETNENTAFGEVGYVLLNNGNPDSPIADVRIRKALAHGLDRQVVIDRRGGGVGNIANGPWHETQRGYLPADGLAYPDFDPDEAKRLVDEYKAENNIDGPVKISYTTTSDPINLGTAELYKQFWDAVGFDTELAQVEQGSFIVLALQGDFEMFGWRNHGGVDPDGQRIWWHSETAVCGKRDACDPATAGLGLNFGRIRDDNLDAQLDIIRESSDEDARTEAAAEVNRIFAEQVYNLWISDTVWMIAKNPNINGLQTFTLPDGEKEIFGNGIGGSHQISQLWCTDGDCG